MKRLFWVTVLVLCLMGCSHKGVCDECEQVEKLNKYTEADGIVHYYCDDCYRMAKLFSGM